MYRKIMRSLKAWKESENRKPLIIQGIRDVGKTYYYFRIWAREL